MKVLFLGYPTSPLIYFLRDQGEEVICWDKPINKLFIDQNNIEFVVSYGYRYIIKEEVLKHLPKRVINLHISYLPYNRGADPTFWSIIEKTQTGVTIHEVDAGLDTGDILVQEKTTISPQDTLRSIYARHQQVLQNLFKRHWLEIKQHKIISIKQSKSGTYHRSKDKDFYLKNLGNNWLDIPLQEIFLYLNKSS